MDSEVWHIEPTSKCILECPLCDRTLFYQKFKNRELNEIDIERLINFFSPAPKKVQMTGNNGDPIYHSKFHTLCSRLKEIGCDIKITTNGSKKNKDWWLKLSKILTKKDIVTFSIDGLRDTNKIYRINSDWDSIMEGVKILSDSPVNLEWKFLVFSHNELQIDEARTLATSMGMTFRLEFSDRWWGDNTLMPSKKYVNDHYNFQRKELQGENQTAKMIPKCLNREMIPYIDSAGNFYPCCYTGLYGFRHKDIFDPRRKKFHISDHTAEEILKNKEVIDFYERTKNYDSASKCCKIYCGVDNG